MAITYIEIPSKKKRDDEWAPWRPKVGRYPGQDPTELPKSMPILIWELLKADARSPEELAMELGTTRHEIHQAILTLRRHDQNIETRRRQYYLVDGPPLQVEETCAGLRLAATGRRIRKLSDTPRGGRGRGEG